MSSVSFNVGFSNERNSSRVLKPPGGGHTDIFGVQETPQPKSQDLEDVAHPIKEAEVGNEEIKTENGTIEEEVQKAVDEVINENVKPKEEPKTDPPKRVRVPPGGFSSGLW